MEKGNWNHDLDYDLIEDILSLLEFLREKGVPADRFTQPEVRALLPETPEARSGAALYTAYETICFMDKIPGGFFIYRDGGDERIVYANKGLLRIFQCDNWDQFQEVTGGTFRGLVHPEDLDAVEQSIQQQIGKSHHDLDYVEYRIIRRDGSVAWIEDYGHLVRGGAAGNFFYVFLGDATEKQERRLREMLHQEQQQRQILADALDKANRAIAAKNEFLTNMSHNMRTPMNAIFGFTALAKMQASDPELLDYLEQLDNSGRQLMDMIEKVLQVSWLNDNSKDQGQEALCDLCQIAWEVCDQLRPQAAGHDLDFHLDCSGLQHGLVCADRERLKQVMTYLTHNAITYTKPGGRVQVALAEGEKSGDRRAYKLTVRDTGIGIGPEFLPHIYEPFARERDSTQSGVTGMGLGLTIAKDLVDRMGGSIQVDSTVGKGSVFTVTLRLREPDEILPGLSDAPTERAAGQRILLVEDNELNRELETEILINGGFVVDAAENGLEAVDKVKASAPEGYDLILMDIQMPVMDGWQASQLIRSLEDPKLANIPIVALSANTLLRDVRRSLDSGMDVYLTKPISISNLLEAIRKAARHPEKQLTNGENMIK